MEGQGKIKGCAFPSLALEPQLAVMPDERSHAHQTPIIRDSVFPPHYTIGQHPGINAVRFPDLSQLLARFLQAQLLALLRCGGNVLNHKHTDREDLAEEPGQSQSPLPACPGRWRQFVLALLAVLTWFAARCLALATSPTHPGRFSHP